MSDSLYRINTGQDCRVVVIATLGELQLGQVTEFEATQEFEKVPSKPLNGDRIEMHLPDGWNGQIKLDRSSAAVDNLADAIEKGWFEGGVLRASTIYQYIRELDGSTSTYRFERAALSITDVGSWKRGSAVAQTIKFFSPRRKKV